MKALYIADDGTEFNDRYDCEVYEQTGRYKKYNDAISGIDNSGGIVAFSDEDFCSKVYTVWMANEEAVDVLKDRFSREAYSAEDIGKPGGYVWSDFIYEDGTEYWIPLEAVIENCEKIIKQVKDYQKKIGS